MKTMQQQNVTLGDVLGIAAGLGVAYLFSRKGTGGTPLPPATTGPAIVYAGFDGVNVAMGAYTGAGALLPKGPGSTIQVSPSWTPQTKDANGARIQWPYMLVVRLGHNTAFGWRTPADLGFPGFFSIMTRSITLNAPSPAIVVNFAAPNDPNVTYDVRTWLFGMKSNDQGQPVSNFLDASNDIGASVPLSIPGDDLSKGAKNPGDTVGNWVLLDTGQVPGAVRIGAQASPSGNFQGVNVAQQNSDPLSGKFMTMGQIGDNQGHIRDASGGKVWAAQQIHGHAVYPVVPAGQIQPGPRPQPNNPRIFANELEAKMGSVPILTPVTSTDYNPGRYTPTVGAYQASRSRFQRRG